MSAPTLIAVMLASLVTLDEGVVPLCSVVGIELTVGTEPSVTGVGMTNNNKYYERDAI